MDKEVTPKSRKYLRKFRQFFATTALGGISLGSSLAWTSPVLPVLQNQNSTTSFHLTHEQGSWVGSLLAVGALISAIPAGYLANHFGHKKCSIAFVIPSIISAILIAVGNDFYTLCVARFISGVATGGVSVVAPMYISEIAEVSLRGTLGSYFEMLVYVGVVMTAVIGALVDYITMTLIMGGLCTFFGIIVIFLPESPSYLVKHDRKDQAMELMKFFKKENEIKQELDHIEDEMGESIKRKSNFKDIIRSKAVIKGLIASVGLTAFQQFSGVDAITFYTVPIFQEASTNLNPYYSGIIVSSVQLTSATISVFVVEKAGRRTFLYISSLGLCACLGLLGIYFHLKKSEVPVSGVMPLFCLMGYFVFFAAGMGPVLWMVNGEIFSFESKGIANGITICTNWSLLFIMTKTFPTMLYGIGPHYTFYLYCVLMFTCAIFVKFCVPETKGKTLQEIQKELSQ